MLPSIISLFGVLGLSVSTLAAPSNKFKPCPPIPRGNLTIYDKGIGPEALDWDPITCKLVVSVLDAAFVAFWDPYKNSSTHLEFPGISHVAPYHVSGIQIDLLSNRHRIFANANSGTPFASGGANLSGTDNLVAIDGATGKVKWIADLTPGLKQAADMIGFAVGGTQDSAQDFAGNSYVPTTFGESLLKVSPDGKKVSCIWVNSTDTLKLGPDIGGLAFHPPSNQIIAWSTKNGQAIAFSLHSKPVTARILPIAGLPAAVQGHLPYFPPMYDNKVMVIGGGNDPYVKVISSSDNWKTAVFRGQFKNPLSWIIPTGVPSFFTSNPLGSVVVEAAGRIYLLEEPLVNGDMPTPESYYYPDVTDAINDILKA